MELGTFAGIAGMGGIAEERSALENPNISLKDADVWYDIFGDTMRTESGEYVSEKRALDLAAVWQCVNMISGDVAKLPLDIFKRLENDEREKDKRHPAFKIVRRQSSEFYSAFHFWRTLLVHALIWNNGYAWIARSGRGEPLEMMHLLPDRTYCNMDHKTGRFWYITEVAGEVHRINPENMFHVRGITVTGTDGERLVEHARHAWGLALARQGFASRFFKHGGRMGGVLKLPLGSSKAYGDNVEEGFRKTYERKDAQFKTLIARDGVDFMINQATPVDSQMNEVSADSVREVARYYNMAPSRLGISDSVSYNSRSEDNQSYLDTTLDPWLCSIESEANTKLLSGVQQQADSHYFEYNRDALTQMDRLKQGQMFAIYSRNRIMVPNEIRKKLNMKPIEGGDEFPSLQGTPAQPKSDGGNDKGENNQPRGPADDSSEVDEDRALSIRRLVFELTSIARRKATKSPNAFLEWIDGDQAGFRDKAITLCETDEFVNEFMMSIRTAETATADELPTVVDSICTNFERQY